MKSPIIPEEELNKLKEVLEEVKEFMEIHSSLSPRVDMDSTDIEKIHAFMYLDLLGDFIKKAKMLTELLELSEEEFVKTATKDGKYSTEEVLSMVMNKILLDMLSD